MPVHAHPRYRFWIHAYPDIDKPIGGVKQLYRLCECLVKLGYNASIVNLSDNFHPSWFSSSCPSLSLEMWKKFNFKYDIDIQVVPETYVPFPVHVLKANSRIIIFNQNFSYTLNSSYKNNVYSDSVAQSILAQYQHEKVVSIWTVSDDNLANIKFLFPDVPSFKIINSIDFDSHTSSFDKKKKITYMPRKNARHSCDVLSYLSFLDLLDGWDLVPLHSMSHEEVCLNLSDSLVFLSFGYPEGFGLPVAEALSYGCFVIGYDGLGGLELFASNNELLPTRNHIQSSFKVSYGDFIGFSKAIASVNSYLANYPLKDISLTLQAQSEFIRSHYNISTMASSISSALNSLDLCY